MYSPVRFFIGTIALLILVGCAPKYVGTIATLEPEPQATFEVWATARSETATATAKAAAYENLQMMAYIDQTLTKEIQAKKLERDALVYQIESLKRQVEYLRAQLKQLASNSGDKLVETE